MSQQHIYPSLMRSIIVASLLLFSQAASAQDNNAGLDYEVLATSIDEMSKRLNNIQAAVDQTRIDPDQWLDKLDYDAEEILKAVSQDIGYHPYLGVLRGVSGTLRAGAGNSLDQALLLASLLKSAGFDARISRGTLTIADAQRLLSNIGNTNLEDKIGYLDARIKTQFAGAEIQSPKNINWEDTNISQRASRAGETLLKALSKAGVKLEPEDITDKLLADSREYFWVQHREGPGDPWLDAHPAFGKHKPPENLAAEEYFANAIPEKYQHKLTIKAALNQRQKDKITTHQLMQPFTRPIANLHGVAITYRNHPNGMTLQHLDNLNGIIESSQFLIPTFNGTTAAGAMAFDLKGRVIDPMAMSSAGAGVFATLSERLDQAAGELLKPGEGKSTFSLESMWLEFIFESPDGSEITVRRYILPPQNDPDRAVKDLLWPLITDHNYMVNSGSQPWSYIANQYLSAGISGNTWYKALMHNYINPGQGTSMPTEEAPRDFDLLSQYQLMDDGPLQATDNIRFRATPSLLGIRRGYRDANTAFIAIDVVANAMANLQYRDNKIWQNPVAAMQRGIWDTIAESVPARSMKLDAVRSSNALNILNQASKQNVELKLIRPGDSLSLAKLSINPTAKLSLQSDLKNGYAIIIPQKTPAGESMIGWWRINLQTGETLGMTADGYGQDLVEYATDLVGHAFTVVQAISSLKACNEMKNDVAKMCCLVEANINNVAGLGIGGMIGSVAGAAGGALFSIVDYGMKAATKKAFNKEQGLMPQAALGCHKMQATKW